MIGTRNQLKTIAQGFVNAEWPSVGEDGEYTDYLISKVEAPSRPDGSWGIYLTDGSAIGANAEQVTTEPRAGDHLRLYGKGFGYIVRGVFINGTKVRYQSPAEHESEIAEARCVYEEKDKARLEEQGRAQARAVAELATLRQDRDDKQVFGTAYEWVNRWNAGARVFSVRMGGLGLAYEEGIQALIPLVLQYLLDKEPHFSYEDFDSKKFWSAFDTWSFENTEFKKIGPSGRMVGAAKNVAAMFYRQGPSVALNDPEIRDRIILLVKGKIQE